MRLNDHWHLECTYVLHRGEPAQNRVRIGEWLGVCSANVLPSRDSILQAEVHSLPTGRGMNVSGVTNEKDDTPSPWPRREHQA